MCLCLSPKTAATLKCCYHLYLPTNLSSSTDEDLLLQSPPDPFEITYPFRIEQKEKIKPFPKCVPDIAGSRTISSGPALLIWKRISLVCMRFPCANFICPPMCDFHIDPFVFCGLASVYRLGDFFWH
ncbi:hypothetical protein CEXT_673561 [Caerostris extrusa]|uniref:Uncharacterized protein n=1 Tax=Caerostris extrusa TaxID=172846 RepID=A0AAV4XRW8_CAEEX|nr:hypothetical protein CEXT_673561 [Caerostris extrusa]